MFCESHIIRFFAMILKMISNIKTKPREESALLHQGMWLTSLTISTSLTTGMEDTCSTTPRPVEHPIRVLTTARIIRIMMIFLMMRFLFLSYLNQ